MASAELRSRILSTAAQLATGGVGRLGAGGKVDEAAVQELAGKVSDKLAGDNVKVDRQLVVETLMAAAQAAAERGRRAVEKQTVAGSAGGNQGARDPGHKTSTHALIDAKMKADMVQGVRVGDLLTDGAHSLRELLAVDPGAAQKVLKSYHRHLKHAYPGKGEVEGPKTLESYLKSHPNWDITLQVEKGRIVFGANTQRFDSPAGPIAVFEHMFAAKGHEENAKGLVDGIISRHRAAGAKAVLTELNDPRIMSREQRQEDEGRPFARGDAIEFMKQLGFKAIDAPYGQPSFGMPGEEVTHLVAGLVVLDPSILQGGKLSPAMHASIVGGFHATFDNLLGKDVNADPTYAAIKERVTQQGGAALLPLDAVRGFIGQLQQAGGDPRQWQAAYSVSSAS